MSPPLFRWPSASSRSPTGISFGVVAFLLEMVPFANLIFAFTNATSAALWAADMEKKAQTAPNLRELAAKAE